MGYLAVEAGVLILLFAIGVAVNTPLIIIYFRSKHIRSTTDKFLFNMVVGDVFSLAFLFPAIFLDLVEKYGVIGSTFWWLCGVKAGLLSSLATLSVFAAFEMAVERFLAVVTPLHYHKLLTKPSVVAASTAGFSISIGVGIVGSLSPLQCSLFHNCGTEDIVDMFWWVMVSLTLTCLTFIIPVLSMGIIYSRIWVEAKRQKAKLTQRYKPIYATHMSNIEGDVEGKRSVLWPVFRVRVKVLQRFRTGRVNRAAKVAILALFVSMVGWGPLHLFQTTQALVALFDNWESAKGVWGENGQSIVVFFALLHPILGPAFYAYRYKRLREELWKLFPHWTLFGPAMKRKRTFVCDVVAGGGIETRATMALPLPPRVHLEEEPQSDEENRTELGAAQAFNFLTVWMYGRRWGRQRESVTSTASFIALLSSRNRPQPVTHV